MIFSSTLLFTSLCVIVYYHCIDNPFVSTIDSRVGELSISEHVLEILYCSLNKTIMLPQMLLRNRSFNCLMTLLMTIII